ncbi:MAG: DUF433 domain-containing protein [Candidatus Omnitrophica bacterium]|nr:DUF433 domain-containing protein [Candidatus Omnitrophota bacterium]MCB9781452.1 DUF433 domain-containing protein [Candidatus Omnitrophota bacterium]MCB9784758.1 DUF433 domain-containing protein [Candidatus Omnitrophota bacterium]
MFDSIVCDRKILDGMPHVKGTRIGVKLLLELLSKGETADTITAKHPELSMEDLRQAILFAACVVEKQVPDLDQDEEFSTSSFQKDGMCGCGQPERMASDPNSPVSFNEILNEYTVDSEGGSRQYSMYFCFFCGGKMPKSKRGDFFTKIDDSELGAAMDLVSKIESEKDIVRILGEPDSAQHFDDLPEDMKEALVRDEPRFKDELMFSRNWSTLQIHIRTYEDGHIKAGYLPKPLQKPLGDSGTDV